MTTSRRGKRRIVVDDVAYYWTTTGTDHGVAVRVATADAFVPGQHGQWLAFTVDYETILAPYEGGWSGSSQRALTPGLVRRAIEAARRRGFTGRDGLPDMSLTPEEAREALAEPPAARISRALEAASAALASARHETVIGLFGDIGRTLAAHPALARPAALDEWFVAAAASLRAEAAQLQAYADAILATLDREWPPWQQQLARCRERRQALATFLECARHAGLADLAAAVDTARLDARL